MESRSVSIAWKIIMVPNLVMVLFGVVFMAVPDVILSSGYGLFSGQSWSSLVTSSPRSAEWIVLFGRMYGVHVMVIAILVIAITLMSFRKGERWSWYTLLIANTFGFVLDIAAQIYMGETAIPILNAVFLSLIYVALGISAKDILSKKST